MKILQVNNVYKRGSTGKIVYDIHRILQKEGIESVVCYGRGQKEFEPNVYKTSSELLAKFNALRARITGLQYNGSWTATDRLLKTIEKEQPDIVHLHCINGYFVNIYLLLNFLKKHETKVVLTLHAEFMYTGNCGHAFECDKWKTGCGDCPELWGATKSYWFDRTHTSWLRMKDAFSNHSDMRIVAVSEWLEKRAKQSPIMGKYPFHVIHNGVDTDETFKPTDYSSMKEKHGLGNERILLYVAPWFSLNRDDIKGGYHVIELAQRLIGTNIKIIVVGNRDSSTELPNNMINVGRINNQRELASYYSMADLVVLTSKRETFSMVCAEALSCGTPVVGFRSGGPETIAMEDYSEFVEYGNLDALEETVWKLLNLKYSVSSEVISKKAEKIYSARRMVSEYLGIYDQLRGSD